MTTEEATKDIRKLKRVRGGHKAGFTRLTTRVDDLLRASIEDDEKLCEAEALLTSLNRKMLDIYRWDTEIQLEIEDEAELEEDTQASTTFDVSSGITIARLTALIDNYKKRTVARTNSSPRSSSPSNTSSLKLPKLQLPSFSGSYTEWNSFRDLFTASVDSNAQLSNSEKLNYLRACVKGDAAKVISSLTITDANYSIAQRLLTDRYENKRSIVNAHLKAIWSQPSIKAESGSALRKLLETTNENLRALEEQVQGTEYWDPLLVFWLCDKMDPESRKQWELDNPGTELLTWKQLSKFLDTRSRALETSGTKMVSITNQSQPPREKRVQVYTASTVCSQNCTEEHKLHACPQFKQMSIPDRYNCVKSNRACFNCLQSGHSASKCPSKFTCRECKQRHHTLLHRTLKGNQDKKESAAGLFSNLPNTASEDTSELEQTADQVTSGHCNASVPINNVLLSTAMVSIKDSTGKTVKLRALLDSGFQASFITENMAAALLLKIRRSQVAITTLGASATEKTKGILATKPYNTVPVNLHVIPRITNQVPTSKVDVSQLHHIRNLKLADPAFNTPVKIGVLLGADVLEDVMMEAKLKDGGLSIRDSIFGWVVSGPVKPLKEMSITSHHIAFEPNHVTDQLLSRLWELENVPEKRHISSEEKRCEEHFDRTTKRKDDGRFIVEMPFKEDCSQLGHSKALAMRRFLNLERKLVRDQSLHERYSAFIKEFIDMGHLEKVPIHELETSRNYYLPHHCVTRKAVQQRNFELSLTLAQKKPQADCLLMTVC